MDITEIFNDKTLQLKLLNKFQPGFLKLDSEGKVEINRTVKLNIPLENMTFSQAKNFRSDTNKIENNYDDSLFSKDSKGANANISKSIKNIFNIGLETNLKMENNNKKENKTKSIRYKHSIFQRFIKVSIPQKDFKLDENIKQEFKIILNKKSDKEKINELFKLYSKYGFGVPFEFILGGKYYIYFDARSEEEKKEIESKLNNLTSISANNQKMGFNFDMNNKNESKAKMENLNIQMDVVGGNSEKKDDFNEWLKSLTLDNIEIIKYEQVIPIHEYCDEDVKNEIENLLERENNKILKKYEQNNEDSLNQPVIQSKYAEVVADPVTIMFLGDNDSGKTSIIKRFTTGQYNSLERTTIAQEYFNENKYYKYDNKIYKVKVQLVDNIVNNERLKDLDLSYLRHCDGIILVYDISNEKSIERLNIWGGLIRDYKCKNVPLFLVPNKADLEKKPLDLDKICEKYEMIKMKDISCKAPDKIDELKAVMNSIIKESYKRKKNRADNLVYKSKGFCF